MLIVTMAQSPLTVFNTLCDSSFDIMSYMMHSICNIDVCIVLHQVIVNFNKFARWRHAL